MLSMSYVWTGSAPNTSSEPAQWEVFKNQHFFRSNAWSRKNVDLTLPIQLLTRFLSWPRPLKTTKPTENRMSEGKGGDDWWSIFKSVIDDIRIHCIEPSTWIRFADAILWSPFIMEIGILEICILQVIMLRSHRSISTSDGYSLSGLVGAMKGRLDRVWSLCSFDLPRVSSWAPQNISGADLDSSLAIQSYSARSAT